MGKKKLASKPGADVEKRGKASPGRERASYFLGTLEIFEGQEVVLRPSNTC